MDKLMWVEKLRQILSPGYVVNLCFFIVFCFSTLLIWREIKVLEEAYVANQRNNLENVAHEFDSLLQFNIDRMIFSQRYAVGVGYAVGFCRAAQGRRGLLNKAARSHMVG